MISLASAPNFLIPGYKILLVEDEPDILEFLREHMSSCGYEITVAVNGRQAADLVLEQQYDVVISDVNMPEMDGLQLLAFIQQHTPATDVIIITGLSREHGFTDVIKAGAVDFILKPFSLDELMAKLHRVQRERFLITSLKAENAERKLAEETMRLHDLRQTALLRLYQMSDLPCEEIVAFFLNSLCELTGSTHAHLAFATHDQSDLFVPPWAVYPPHREVPGPSDTISPEAVLTAQAIRQRKLATVYAAQSADELDAVTTHNKIICSAAINAVAMPVFDRDRPVMIAYLAGKAHPYEHPDNVYLKLLLDGLWSIIRRKEAEKALLEAHGKLEERVHLRTLELDAANHRMSQEIKDRRLTEEALRQSEENLSAQKQNLEETNTALKVLLQKRQQDRQELEEEILFNVREIVGPYIEKLKKTELSDRQKNFLGILETNLHDIIAPFSRSLVMAHLKLTPAETKIANLIRQGKTSKEIAELLSISCETVNVHRKRIRKKSGIANRSVHLRTLLCSLPPSGMPSP